MLQSHTRWLTCCIWELALYLGHILKWSLVRFHFIHLRWNIVCEPTVAGCLTLAILWSCNVRMDDLNSRSMWLLCLRSFADVWMVPAYWCPTVPGYEVSLWAEDGSCWALVRVDWFPLLEFDCWLWWGLFLFLSFFFLLDETFILFLSHHWALGCSTSPWQFDEWFTVEPFQLFDVEI